MEYWEAMAERTLPYLKERRIAVQQKFDGNILYRRHMPGTKTGSRIHKSSSSGVQKGNQDKISAKKTTKTRWIYIKNVDEIMEWARLHTYSFHTHLEGDKTTLFAMDLDKRSRKMDFNCMKISAFHMAEILEEKGINYLCKFSGGNGFHFLWEFDNEDIKGMRIFEVEQRIINRLAALCEDKIQRSKDKKAFYEYIKKDDPIFILSSQDKDHPNSILMDEFILKRRGVIRSIYSVHPFTDWASKPVGKNKIFSFNPKTEATTKATIELKKDYQMPENKIKEVLKKLEINN